MNEFKTWKSYRQFANRVQSQARFIRTADDDDFLREVLRTSENRKRELPADFGLWRAQLGHDWQPIYQDGENIGDFPVAFSPHRMKPQPGRAKEGRANPKGIPVLYLSNHKKTAMSEVRPWLGSLLSCAHFRTTRPMTLVDFSVNHGRSSPYYFVEPETEKREEIVWTDIDKAFSEPTTPEDDSADYVPTQVIAEMFNNEGYDGLAYKSAFGKKGFNIVLFNPDDAELRWCALFKAKSLDFRFKQDDNPYWIDEHGATKTNSIVGYGPAPRSDKSDS